MIKKYILQSINICLLIVLTLFLIIGLINVKMLNRTQNIIIITSLIALLVLSCKMYFSKKIKYYNAGAFLTLILNIILLFEIVTINNRYEYLQNLSSREYTYKTYEVYVQKSNTTYNNLNKLEGKRIGLLRDNDKNVINYLDNLVNINYFEYDDIESIYEGIRTGEIQAFIINSDSKDELIENKYSNKIRVIYTNKIKYNI